MLQVSEIGGVEIGEIVTARILHDSTLLVGDRSNNRLLRLDLSGRVIRRFGRTGGGPGEFRQLFMVSITPEDTVYVYDPSQGQVVFSPEGQFARVVRTASNAKGVRPPFPVGWLGGGRGLAFAEILAPANPAGWIDSARVVLVDANLRVVRRLGTAPLGPRYLDHGAPTGVAFGPRLLGVATRGGYCFGYSTELRLSCRGESGAPRELTDHRPARPTSASLIAQYKDRTINPPGSVLNAVPPVLRGQRREAANTQRFAPALPAFSALIGDHATGDIWVRDFVPEEALRWARCPGP